MDDIVIVAAARTPMGGFQGDFASLTCAQLGSAAIKGAVATGEYASSSEVVRDALRDWAASRTVPAD